MQENVDFLLDSTHPASYIVRDLTIGPFEHPERTIDESSLVKILSTLDILLDFRYVPPTLGLIRHDLMRTQVAYKL